MIKYNIYVNAGKSWIVLVFIPFKVAFLKNELFGDANFISNKIKLEIFMAFSSHTVEIWVRKGKNVYKLLMK